MRQTYLIGSFVFIETEKYLNVHVNNNFTINFLDYVPKNTCEMLKKMVYAKLCVAYDSGMVIFNFES